MDGVIVDTEPVHYYAYQKHFEQLGIQVSDALYGSFTGKSTRNVYEMLQKEFGIESVTQDLVEVKRGIFNEAFDTKQDLHLLDGVEDLIKDLHKNGMQLILASSSAKVTIERVFKRFGLHKYFSHIVSGEDFPKSKPDPAIFLEAQRLSGHLKHECVIIEDSANGVTAANAAGIYSIGYLSENSVLQNLNHAKLIIAHFKDLNFEKIRRILPNQAKADL